jgi:hypothetical protein
VRRSRRDKRLDDLFKKMEIKAAKYTSPLFDNPDDILGDINRQVEEALDDADQQIDDALKTVDEMLEDSRKRQEEAYRRHDVLSGVNDSLCLFDWEEVDRKQKAEAKNKKEEKLRIKRGLLPGDIPIDPPDSIAGYHIIECPEFTETKILKSGKILWIFPWKETETIPMEKVIVVECFKMIYAHPQTVRKLRERESKKDDSPED